MSTTDPPDLMAALRASFDRAKLEMELEMEPIQCQCPHSHDWHSTHGCEARGCGCEVEC